MAFDLQHAKQFLVSTGLPSAPDHVALTEGMGLPALESTKQQSLVVGSNVVSFTTGVEANVRQAIADASLFAQLAASKALGSDPDPLDYFDSYFSNLYKIGWIIQDKETAEYTYEASTLGVHQAIIAVITAFLEPIPGAAYAVITVLNGLHQMDKDAPFITLFNQESRHGQVGRFQFTYVYADAQHGLMAKAMAFAIKADNTLTQVLFFKLQKGRTSLKRSIGSLSVDAQAMEALRPQLAAKMNAYRSAYIAGVDLGEP